LNEACSATPPNRDSIIGEYRYLCRRGARKFVRPGLERSDLEQVASIGLIKATDRYDAAARTPFEAFAWLLIIGELMHFVRDHERLVRIPRRLQKLERAYRETEQCLGAQLGREPSEREVGAALRLAPAALTELREARGLARPDELDESNIVSDAAWARPSSEDRVLLHLALAELPAGERLVIVGIYLLGLTHIEIGRRLGLRAKTVSGLHRAALGRMQRVCGAA
jgi:RNA polymerase sigma-B factor